MSFGDILTILADSLRLQDIYIGVILAVIGLTIAILSKRIARIVRKSNDIKNDDKTMLGIKVFGLVLLYIALMVIIFLV